MIGKLVLRHLLGSADAAVANKEKDTKYEKYPKKDEINDGVKNEEEDKLHQGQQAKQASCNPPSSGMRKVEGFAKTRAPFDQQVGVVGVNIEDTRYPKTVFVAIVGV